MRKRQITRMQQQTRAQGQHIGWCVQGIAQHGVTDALHVHAQLMGATGHRLEFDQLATVPRSK